MSRDLLRYHHLLFILDVLFVPPSSRSCSRSGLVSVRIRRHWTTCRLVGRLSALVVLCAFDILVPQPFQFGRQARAPSDTRRRLQPTASGRGLRTSR
ncbi:hypothetical protein BDZ89DRAFT_122131 [Hymenopellis radicata]|nr:hypothetical protein BDZ89DRAFT_122131 [Hymenopellis radicata]